jgi:hypothetical protein
MFFTIARAQDSTRTADLQTSDKVTLGIGFGQNYMDQLRSNGVTFNGNLSPVTLSIGYKFKLN